MPKIEEIRKVSLETQNAVLQSLSVLRHGRGCPRIEPVWHELKTWTNAQMIDVFGSISKTLNRFVHCINHHHPELTINGNSQWLDFCEDVTNIVHDPSTELREKLNNNYKELIRDMQCFKPRFVSDCNERDILRQQKNFARNISMKRSYMIGENCFYEQSTDFKPFIRFSENNYETINKLKEQQNEFIKHGMRELANAVTRRIKNYKDQLQQQYMGLRRVTPADTAIVLARLHGMLWHDATFIVIPTKVFESDPFWKNIPAIPPPEDVTPFKLKVKAKKQDTPHKNAFIYQPRLYPLSSFPIPTNVANILAQVECFRDLNGCPIFDYYWVVCPSVNLDHNYFHYKENTISICIDDKEFDYTNELEAAHQLDKALVQKGFFIPAVLGERDGVCFFLGLMV